MAGAGGVIRAPVGSNQSIHWRFSTAKNGAFRVGYEGEITSGPNAGRKVLIKVWREGRRSTCNRNMDYCLRDSQTAGEYATVWNRKIVGRVPGAHALKFILPAVRAFHEEHSDANGVVRMWKGEKGHIEPLLTRWEKFNNNAEYSNINHHTPQAFTHWTWHVSDGDVMVADIQGEFRGSKGVPYKLTDPAVITRRGGESPTDGGHHAMLRWFRAHQCNDICRRWRRPCEYQMGVHAACNTHTVYYMWE